MARVLLETLLFSIFYAYVLRFPGSCTNFRFHFSSPHLSCCSFFVIRKIAVWKIESGTERKKPVWNSESRYDVALEVEGSKNQANVRRLSARSNPRPGEARQFSKPTTTTAGNFKPTTNARSPGELFLNEKIVSGKNANQNKMIENDQTWKL